MHGRTAVVLPSTFQRQTTLGILAGDSPAHVAPLAALHRMDDAARGISPASDALGADGIGGRAVELHPRGEGLPVGIAGHDQGLAVHEQLVRDEVRRNLSGHNALGLGLPHQARQQASAADHGLGTRNSGEHHRSFGRAAIGRRQHQGFRQAMDAGRQPESDRLLPQVGPGGRNRVGQPGANGHIDVEGGEGGSDQQQRRNAGHENLVNQSARFRRRAYGD